MGQLSSLTRTWRCVYDGGVHWIFCRNGIEDECIRSALVAMVACAVLGL